MTLISGLTFSELDVESDNFAKLAYNGLELVMAQTLNNIEFIVVAASREPDENRKKFYVSENLSFIRFYWDKYVKETLIPELYSIFDKSTKAITSRIHSIWSMFNPKPLNAKNNASTRQYIIEATGTLNGISDELSRHAYEQLSIGINLNESIPQLRDRLMNAANLTRARAESIARTETVAANNMASLVQVQELGGVGKKTWLAKIDDRTRETHQHADDQTVSLNQRFRVGMSLLAFPGDPTGAPGDVINCRCTLTFDIDFFSLEKSTLLT